MEKTNNYVVTTEFDLNMAYYAITEITPKKDGGIIGHTLAFFVDFKEADLFKTKKEKEGLIISIKEVNFI